MDVLLLHRALPATWEFRLLQSFLYGMSHAANASPLDANGHLHALHRERSNPHNACGRGFPLTLVCDHLAADEETSLQLHSYWPKLIVRRALK